MIQYLLPQLAGITLGMAGIYFVFGGIRRSFRMGWIATGIILILIGVWFYN